MSIWDELIQRVADHQGQDQILAWLSEQGWNDLDARRALQYVMEGGR